MSGTPTPDLPPPTGAPAAQPAAPKPVVKRRRGRAGLYVAILVVIVVIVLAAVGYSTNWYGLTKSSKSVPACTSGQTLSGDGAQVATPLVAVWAGAYHSQTNNSVTYGGAGTGTGLDEFTSGSLDFALTDDPLTPTEASALPTPALTLPFIGGALVIIYNLPGLNTAHLNLTGAVLAQIYLGNITTWNNSTIQALNPGVNLPDKPIATVHRSDNAGTTYVLSDFLSQSSTYWAKNLGKGISVAFPKTSGGVYAEKGNSAVISTVAGNPYTIGYSDLTDVLTSSSPPAYAAIGNPKGHYIVANITNTESAIVDKVASMKTIPASTASWFNVSMINANGSGDYPIATFLYMFVFQNASKGFEPSLVKTQALVQWVNWVLTTGQPYADETSPSPLYYVPLPSPIVSVDQSGLGTMTFDGASIPACK